MNWLVLFKALAALIFVIGLMLVVIWVLKLCQIKFGGNKSVNGLKKNSRLAVVEHKRIDAKNSLVLVKRDNVEHLLLIGQSQNTVVENNIKDGK